MPITGSMQIADPLPQQYLSAEPGIGGRIKERPEDFQVQELPLYTPCGSGEHLCLLIEKTGVAHGELMGCLRRHFAVREQAIGFAGMKDKIGVTRQTVSVHVAHDPASYDLGHDRIRVLQATRHRHKIRRGHLAGNRFSIRIRQVDRQRLPAVLERLQALERSGVPNYFGAQRFGYRRGNHRLGALLLREDWAGFLAELLGTGGAPYPAHQQERRALYEAGQLEPALQQWTVADRAERVTLHALLRGLSEREACLALGKTSISFLVSALQSAIFNRVLDRRLADGTLSELREGDLAWKHDSRAVFRVTPDELIGPELAARAAALEVSPSGPLWGTKMTRASGATDETELEALGATGLPLEVFCASARSPAGGRRPLRERLMRVDAEGGVDEHGEYIGVAFDLPRGVYATVVLREIMKREPDSWSMAPA